MSDYLIRFQPLRKPMTVDATGHLVHAVPATAYATFQATDHAESAIRSGISEAQWEHYEIVSRDEHEQAMVAAERRSKKVKRAKAKELRAMAADGKEIT